MLASLKYTCVDGFLSHPSDPDGCGDRMAHLTIDEDSLSGEWRLRMEVKARQDLGEEASRDDNNYGWHEASVLLPLADAKYMHRILGVILAQAEGEDAAKSEGGAA